MLGFELFDEEPHFLDQPIEDDDIIKMWQEKRIGRRTLQAYKDFGSDLIDKSPQWLKNTGHLFKDVLHDMSTLEGNEKYHPGHLITYGTMKTLQGVGVVTDTVIGKPVSFLGHNVLGLDKDVADLTGDVAEAVLTPMAAGKVVKGINTAVGTTKSLLGGGITANAGTGLIKSGSKLSKLPKITVGSNKYNQIAKKAKAFAEKKGDLTGFGNHFVDETGVWRSWKWNKKTKKVSILDEGGRQQRNVRRVTAEKLDEQTLLKQFGGDRNLLQQYQTTNRSIVRNLRQELKAINDRGKAKYGAKWDPIELEHIYDVQFFWKLRNEVSKFSGRGANEAINLTVLKKSINQRTGAQAKTLSGSDALIKNNFPNYNKAVTEFYDFKIFDTVKNMKSADWKRLTDLAIKNPNMNIHEIIIEHF